MLLASVDAVVRSLGFDPMSDISMSAMQAVDAAEAQLAAILSTEFDAGTFTDTFFVREPPFMSAQAFETEFRLRRGLVTALTSVKANYAIAQFGTSTDVDVTSTVVLHPDKGVVRDFQTRYLCQYVQITYTAGFPVDANNPESYDLTKVPDWLQQAARLNAMIGLADSPALSEAQIKLDTKVLGMQYQALIGRKLRYAPSSLLPL